MLNWQLTFSPKKKKVSYQKVNAKVITCQSDLCNSPTAVQNLPSATLCRDGFYMWKLCSHIFIFSPVATIKFLF